MASTDLAATYAALILADDGIEITADKINALTSAANVDIEPIWASLLAKALEGKNEVPKAEEKVEEKEESDDDMGFGLFD
ncbi:60S acidic ribosomal protein P1 [Ephemerocybe angulata]|uniref:60S acidic ribosomal protein P1 n=1 Tax=Ephemerocybe angulata TaxID=980116 RepID=A0A8H6MA64_9AGAR|nr:60S acidic ribosomal protein P1 [Tulosesus angulatus]